MPNRARVSSQTVFERFCRDGPSGERGDWQKAESDRPGKVGGGLLDHAYVFRHEEHVILLLAYPRVASRAVAHLVRANSLGVTGQLTTCGVFDLTPVTRGWIPALRHLLHEKERACDDVAVPGDDEAVLGK